MSLPACEGSDTFKDIYFTAKIISTSATICLKKGYFMTFADSLPSSHYPQRVSPNAALIHDYLAYLIVPVTYRYLKSSMPVIEFVEKETDKILNEYKEILFDFTNLKEDPKDDVKLIIKNFIKAYISLISSLSINNSSILKVYPERYLISREPNVPLIGVPDVLVQYGDSFYIIDWKLSQAPIQSYYYQLLVYYIILEKLIQTNSLKIGRKLQICPYIIHVTSKKLNIKIINFFKQCVPKNLNIFKEAGIIFDDRSERFGNVTEDIEKIQFVVKSLQCLISSHKHVLKEIIAKAKLKTIRVGFNRIDKNTKSPTANKWPCKTGNWECEYLWLCAYRFTPSRLLPDDLKIIRKNLSQISRIALKKKSEGFKGIIDNEKCVTFERAYFKENDPRVLVLEHRRQTSDFNNIMNYVLGRTTVYVFLNDGISYGTSYMSPHLFGRYESDEIEISSNQLRAFVRMISPIFGIRWFPLYILYREGPRDVFEGEIKVCAGNVPHNIELKALTTVENALVKKYLSINDNMKEWFERVLIDLIMLKPEEEIL